MPTGLSTIVRTQCFQLPLYGLPGSAGLARRFALILAFRCSWIRGSDQSVGTQQKAPYGPVLKDRATDKGPGFSLSITFGRSVRPTILSLGQQLLHLVSMCVAIARYGVRYGYTSSSRRGIYPFYKGYVTSVHLYPTRAHDLETLCTIPCTRLFLKGCTIMRRFCKTRTTPLPADLEDPLVQGVVFECNVSFKEPVLGMPPGPFAAWL